MHGRIFISHAHQDGDIADRIVADLSAMGLSPWVYRNEIRPGDSFVAAMDIGLSEASYLILLLSRAAVDSEWVRREWMNALAADVPVLPARLDDAEVPAILRHCQYFDLRADPDVGIKSIVSFFRTEMRPTQAGPSGRRGETKSLLHSASRRQIRLVSVHCLNEADVKSFCFDEDINPNTLQGTSVHERVLSLLHSVASDGITVRFATWISREKRRCVANRIRELQAAGEWDWN